LSGKSLTKRKRNRISKQTENLKVRHEHLHLVKGEQQVNHSHSPIAATDIEKLHALNPKYAEDLFDIMKKSVKVEEEETSKFYNAIDKEQDNDKLAIERNSENKKLAMILATSLIVIMLISGIGLIYYGYSKIGGSLITVVMLGVVKSMLTGKSDKSEKP